MQLHTIIRRSFSFGLTSGIITTLGLMVGLDSSTNSRMVVLGGIFTIAVADAFSDAFGMHISEEAGDPETTGKKIWAASAATFIAKFLFALTFTVPVIFLSLPVAIAVNVGWGLLLLGLLSAQLALEKKKHLIPILSEHWTIALVVIALSYLVGQLIKAVFGS
jgi:vacuolar iron transporter family protein